MKVTAKSKGLFYTADLWITNGGAAITVDGDPNVTPPAANRILRSRGDLFLSTYAGNVTPSLFATLADGVTATVRHWWYDDVQLLWVPTNVEFALTYANSNGSQSRPRMVPGTKFHCQVKANDGVTKIAFSYR